MRMQRYPKYMIQATAESDNKIWHDSADTLKEARQSAKDMLASLREAGVVVERCDVFGCDRDFYKWSPDPLISLVK